MCATDQVIVIFYA